MMVIRHSIMRLSPVNSLTLCRDYSLLKIFLFPGQIEVIRMLTTRSRSLVVDAKNNLGITPLMKAAIQGRYDCAKQLMLASNY